MHVRECPYVVSNDMLEFIHSICFHLCNDIIDSIHHFGFFHTLNCSNFLKHCWHRGRFSGYENKGCWHSKSPHTNNYVTSSIFQCRLGNLAKDYIPNMATSLRRKRGICQGFEVTLK